MHNLYEQFRQLIPDPPLQAGTVIDVGSGVVTVALPVVAESRRGALRPLARRCSCATTPSKASPQPDAGNHRDLKPN